MHPGRLRVLEGKRFAMQLKRRPIVFQREFGLHVDIAVRADRPDEGKTEIDFSQFLIHVMRRNHDVEV